MGNRFWCSGRGVAAPVCPAPASGRPLVFRPAGLVSINSATLEQLDTLPGIGPVLAQAIIDWRAENGRSPRSSNCRKSLGLARQRSLISPVLWGCEVLRLSRDGEEPLDLRLLPGVVSSWVCAWATPLIPLPIAFALSGALLVAA